MNTDRNNQADNSRHFVRYYGLYGKPTIVATHEKQGRFAFICSSNGGATRVKHIRTYEINTETHAVRLISLITGERGQFPEYEATEGAWISPEEEAGKKFYTALEKYTPKRKYKRLYEIALAALEKINR